MKDRKTLCLATGGQTGNIKCKVCVQLKGLLCLSILILLLQSLLGLESTEARLCQEVDRELQAHVSVSH